uniref:Uncharacterized protein n=1 Tax=Anguilla anguilla TaxID=7936 RepID=A0A0E9TER2_ANGAN
MMTWHQGCNSREDCMIICLKAKQMTSYVAFFRVTSSHL